MITGFAGLFESYGSLGGEMLLKPMIREVFPDRIALVSSFGAESAVLLHMVSGIDPETPVIFLETGKLFAETLRYQQELTEHLGLRNVRLIRPEPRHVERLDPEGTLNGHNTDLCCHIRKVEPLERALRGYTAWITGRKRFHGGQRTGLDHIEHADWRVKINPLADWSAKDIKAYFEIHKLPRHPLSEKGYLSIGCVPCTSVAADADDPRSGRWAGEDKSECGIHWSANGKPIRLSAMA